MGRGIFELACPAEGVPGQPSRPSRRGGLSTCEAVRLV